MLIAPNQVDFMAAQKLNAAKKDIDKLIQKHEELFNAWRAHRSKSDDRELNSEGEPERECASKSPGSLEL